MANALTSKVRVFGLEGSTPFSSTTTTKKVNMKTQVALIAALLLAVVTIIGVGTSAVNAKSEYDSDLFESRKPFSDGIVLQCAGRKDHIDCNWDRYNAELDKQRADKQAAIDAGNKLLEHK